MYIHLNRVCGALVARPAAVLSMALVVGLASACGGGGTPPQGAGGAGGRGGRGAMAMPVEMVTLAEHPVDQVSEFVGAVKSRRSTTIQPQVEGFLTRIAVKSGDRVAPGTVLFEIDSTSQQAVVANLESLRAAREADATFARQQADRARQLLAAGAMSQQEFDQAQTAQRTSEAQFRAVEEQIRQQRNELAYFRVTAPTAGIVGDIPVRLGDRVTRSTQMTTVDDNAGLELYLNIPIEDAPRLKPGLPVRLLDEAGAVAATERISFISPSVDDATQTVLVKTPISGGSLRTDQFVRARVVWSSAPALSVPLVCVTRVGGAYFVFVAEAAPGGGLVARQRPITVGPLVGNDYVVLGGLNVGDQVIVAGIQKIGDGSPVAAGPPGGGPAGGRGETGNGRGR